MRRVTRLALVVTYDLASRDHVPAFRRAGRQEKDSTRPKVADPQHDGAERLGAGWEGGQPPGKGVRLSRVVVRSPADQAGLQPGDRVVALAGRPIRTADELTWAVTAAAGTPVSIVVERPGHDGPLELTAQLAGSPMRVGIRWRVDDAEPGAVVLTEVVPGSPAARAGLQPGDHVYQIAGRDFSGEAEFRQMARTLPGPLMLLIERDGQLRAVEIRLESQPLERAA
jgi:C-terminal processing protease CtpA/Prc